MDRFPLVLCGPIVRRTVPDSVCVWVALQKACTVELSVYEDDGGSPGKQRMRGRRSTVRLAANLHVAAVTAAPLPGTEKLAWGGRYLYDLAFNLDNAWRGLYAEGVLRPAIDDATPLERLVYDGCRLPGLRLPAARLGDLRLAHGSCRKPHGAGADGLAALDDLLATDPAPPQVLLLTGDQIYADDVDPGLLQAIIDLSTVLAGGVDYEKEKDLAAYRDRLIPGHRQPLMADKARFTSGEAECHLVTWAEYITMYLFAWSDIPWEPGLSRRESLSAFRHDLPRARRALANVSTYMMFDDHDVTDDWNRTGRWVSGVAGSEIGSRVVRNALAAYGVFQHWGNDPAAFDDGAGGGLLAALDGWDGTAGEKAEAVGYFVQVPGPSGDPEPKSEDRLRWHHSIDTPEARIVSLDTRTRRRFRDPTAAPGLMSNAAIDEVLDPAAEPRPATIVVSPAPVLGVGLIEFIQDKVSGLIDRYKKETELITGSDKFDAEAWAFDPECYDYLLERLASLRRVVILSGDVHYGFGASLVAKDRDARIVNFVSSALHNETFTHTVSKLLSWLGNRHLEALSDEEPPPVEIPRTAAARKGSTKSLTFEEGLLHDEPPEQAAPAADRGEVDLEAFPASSKRADVVGSANFGDVTFPPGQVLHRLRWQRIRRRRIEDQQTEHLATLPID